MRRNKYSLIIPWAITMFLGGCVTLKARVPWPAAPIQSTAQASAASILMSPAKDGRSNEKLGSLGGASLAADASLADYIQATFTNGLAQQGYVVISATAAPAGTTRKVLITLEAASEGSFDALLQPAKGDVSFAVQVFTIENKAVFAQTYSGTYSETIGIHGQNGYEEDVGRILATAADRAIEKALADQQFQSAIRPAAAQVQTSMSR